MSEYIDNQTRRRETLKRLIRQLHEGWTVEDVKDEFAALLDDVGATEIAEIEQALIAEGLPGTEVKRLCDVHVAPGDQWSPQASAQGAAPPPVETPAQAGGLLHLDTGALTAQEINLLLTHLPVDITYVGRDDAVRFFSQTRERIFPRSPAIIGRKVQQCHPPASVHRVQGILDDFRAGRRDQAEFWIQMQGKFIHIRYFAVRDERGEYQGTIEVSQDLTRIRTLEGERRLLDEGGE
jgi:DUF438 domain-containing protein